MKINGAGILIVIITTSIILIIIFNVLLKIDHVAGYDIFDGTISNITTTKYACSPCIKTGVGYNCDLYKDTTCYGNTIYATNKHTRCSLSKRIIEPENQQQFLLDTPIGTKVKWYKHLHNHKCRDDISNIHSDITAAVGLAFFILGNVLCLGCIMMFDIDKRYNGNKYQNVNKDDKQIDDKWIEIV